MNITYVQVWMMSLALTTACTAGPSSPPDSPPDSPSAGPPDSSTSVLSATTEEAAAWLDRIEVQSKQLLTLNAKLRYDRIQGLVGDRQRRLGTLAYESGPPSRFSLHFDRLLVDRRLEQEDRWYIYDGQWLVERYDKDKLFIKRQVTPRNPPRNFPQEAPEGTSPPPDMLALGQGPFALPITQEKQRVLERFVVTVAQPATDDPPNSVHLHLLPKPDRDSPFTEVDLWYDRDSLLPVRVRTIDDSENESVIDLTELRPNDAVPPKLLDTSAPTEPGWRVEVKPWEEDGEGAAE